MVTFDAFQVSGRACEGAAVDAGPQSYQLANATPAGFCLSLGGDGGVDAGVMDAGSDGGADAGQPELDAGPSEPDAGTELDAGQSELDAGRSELDGGQTMTDAGQTMMDAGQTMQDGGADPGPPGSYSVGCGCQGSSGVVVLGGLCLMLRRRRRG
jgi:hypothetical protein